MWYTNLISEVLVISDLNYNMLTGSTNYGIFSRNLDYFNINVRNSPPSFTVGDVIPYKAFMQSRFEIINIKNISLVDI